VSLFDLTGVITDLASDTISVTTFAKDTYDANGRLEARTSTGPVTYRASVQPINKALDRKSTRGFNETSSLIAVWALGPLLLRDEIVIVGRESEGVFEVEKIDTWNANGNYSQVIARRRDAHNESDT
jgi:hypothetical protein